MITNCANFPPIKWQLKEAFGFLSFQTALINLDVIGIRIVAEEKGFQDEVVIVFFRGKEKVGFAYEGEKLTTKQSFSVFSAVPEDWNEIQDYEKRFLGKTEVLYPAPENYVFINETEVQPLKKVKP